MHAAHSRASTRSAPPKATVHGGDNPDDPAATPAAHSETQATPPSAAPGKTRGCSSIPLLDHPNDSTAPALVKNIAAAEHQIIAWRPSKQASSHVVGR